MKSYRIRHHLFLPEEMSRRLERNTSWLQRNQARLKKALVRMMATGARNPVRKVARTASAKLFAQLIDEIAAPFASNAAPTTDDLTTRKLRSLQ